MALLVGELYALLLLEKKAFMAGLAEAEVAAKASGTSIGTTFLSMGKIVALGLAAAVVGLGAFGAASIGASMEFQKGMANVQTLIGTGSAVDARIKELGQSVKDMSIITGKSLGDLTRGLYDVIGTFTDTADSAKWLEIAAKAGAAGMSTTHDAILLLSAVTKAYGDTSFEAAQKASDLIFETANLGVTTFPEMAASMGKVLPIAAALKVSQEELFGAMAALTGVTGDTALVTTQLRSIMSSFLKPNTLMTAAIKETGFASGTAMVQQLGLSGAMKLIGGTSVVAERGIAKVFGRVEALTAVLALSGAQAADWVWKTEAMRKAAGRTDRAFAIQQATVSAMVNRIGAAIGVLAVAIGDKLMPAFHGFLSLVEQHMPDIADAVLSAVDVIQAAFGAVVGVIAWFADKVSTAWKILGDLGMQGPVIAAAVSMITAAFVAWGIAAVAAAIPVFIAMLPILLVIAAIALAVKALQLVFEFFGVHVEDVMKGVGDFMQSVTKSLIEMAGTIMGVLAAIPGPFQEGAKAVQATLDGMKADISAWGTNAAGLGRDAGLSLSEGFIKGMGDGAAGGPVLNPYKKAGADAGAAILQGLNGALPDGLTLTEAELEDLGISMDDALAAGITVGEPVVAQATKSLVERFGTSLGGVITAAKESGGAAMAEMAQAIVKARQAPLDAFDTLKALMKSSLSPLKEVGKQAGILVSKTLAAALKDGRPDVRAQALATAKLAADRLGELVKGGGKAGKEAMIALEKGIRSKNKDVRDASMAAKNAALQALQSLIAPAYTAGADAGRAFTNGFAAHARADASISVNGTVYGSGHGHASGSWKIPHDELAFLHEGEMVVPAVAAQRLRESSTSGSYGDLGSSGGPRGGPMIGTMHLTVNAGSDVSRPAAQRFGQTVLDVIAGGLREQTARGVS